MNFLKTRVLPLVLSLVMIVPVLAVPASAGFGGPPVTYEPFRLEAIFDADLFEQELNRLAGDNSADHCAYFSELAYIANRNNWSETSAENLALLAYDWNANYGSKYSSTATVDSHPLDDGTEVKFVRVIINDSRLSGGGRNEWSWCLNDGAGKILVALPAEDESIAANGQWLQVTETSLNRVHMVSYDLLFNAAQDLGCSLYRMGNYWVIKKTGGVAEYIFCNKDGERFVAQYEEEKWATNQDRPQTNITENGDIVEGDLIKNDIGIDLSGMTVTLPDGTLNLIDKLIYDESTKTYYIDSHDTYNTENNYYVTNNYSWTYHINYTSITYIGQTEEYNKYYEVYYELPDGRSSADLTKEDLEQLNLSVDVIPYGRSADDTSLRSLYHFDGDTKDSSYWNYCTRFNWRMGASLTYVDSGVFDGALYLDEKLHELRCYMPSNIGISDFTLQFRYYQSATLTPVTDSYIYVGGRVICYMNGSHFVGFDGVTLLAEIPVGTWNEIAVMRENGQVRVYLNGQLIYNVTINDALSDFVELHFGSEQQTYKYIDELRVLNYSLQTAGLPYECTSVPYDTNLTLVLPDSAVPVADEYWSFDQTITPAWSKDFSTGYSDAFSADVTMSPQTYFEGHLGKVQYYSSLTSVTEYEGFTSVVSHSTPTLPPSGAGTGLIIPISGYRTTPEYFDFTGFKSRYSEGGNSGTHTFSLVTRDGETCSLTFDMFYPIYMENRVRASASFDWGSIYYIEYSNVLTYILVVPNKGVPLDFVYMEIVKGSTPNTGHEFVQSVTGIDKDDLNTPTLAVRTDIDITSYQIGGVRPSLPKKGMVWAMVENERISSLQIYNGQAWEGVDGRIWTGERWIPMNSYNIITLQDLYDIVDATPNYEYIYSEAGFWAWWQKSWNAFTEKLFLTLGSGGTGGGASGGAGSSELNKVDLDSAPVVSDPDEEDGKSLWQFIILVVDGGKSVVTGTRELFSGVVSTIPDTMDGITGAFDSGGIAVGIFDGSDPDAADIESEVLDPWRYQ